MYIARNSILEITTEYDGITRVPFQFNERELKRALIEFMEREYPERLLDGGDWSFVWRDENPGSEKLTPTVIMTQELAEDREANMARRLRLHQMDKDTDTKKPPFQVARE